MKQTFVVIVSVMTIGLAGCGSDEPVEVPTPSAPIEQPVDTNTSADTSASEQPSISTDTMKVDMDQLSFKEIKVEVSYGKDREYEAEIEQDDNEPFEAKIEDEVNGVYLQGQEAFNDLYPRAEQLQLTKDSTKEETIEQVLQAFDLESSYEKFEVEIRFHDGSKLDVEDRK
ncbi:hypothetical protein DV702_10610 [Sporosarcina sp. PTS2304]|uniref:YusW family protein n=1 Tax=Sporosarcina sp. PTS2304 TaxID=2283194 RepID=UPI000E0DA7AD|nr:YusW family protein [Sporosarcina sp. PTS2304]AXI00128.1 hypothetical protein DV702_10610 [Sporosarcina sp. PTS2304]